MKTYVLFVEVNGIEHYWTGMFLDYKVPDLTNRISEAKHYECARDAYDDAAPHKKLQSFRVGKREASSAKLCAA